jgi:hypothetical protein
VTHGSDIPGHFASNRQWRFEGFMPYIAFSVACGWHGAVASVVVTPPTPDAQHGPLHLRVAEQQAFGLG